MSSTPPPPPPIPLAPIPPSPSKAAVGIGVGGAGFAVWLVDRLMFDGGEQAAAVLTRIGPLLGPVWASWPLLALVVVLSWMAVDRWKASQVLQAATAAAAAAASAELTHGVRVVGAEVTSLRSEVHGLRGALQAHADATDLRLRTHEEGLGALTSEVSQVRSRVDLLERPPKAPRRPRISSDRRVA